MFANGCCHLATGFLGPQTNQFFQRFKLNLLNEGLEEGNGTVVQMQDNGGWKECCSATVEAQTLACVAVLVGDCAMKGRARGASVGSESQLGADAVFHSV